MEMKYLLIALLFLSCRGMGQTTPIRKGDTVYNSLILTNGTSEPKGYTGGQMGYYAPMKILITDSGTWVGPQMWDDYAEFWSVERINPKYVDSLEARIKELEERLNKPCMRPHDDFDPWWNPMRKSLPVWFKGIDTSKIFVHLDPY